MIQESDIPAEQTRHVGLMDEAAFEASLVDASMDDAGSAIDPMLTDDHAMVEGQPSWVGRQLGHFRLLRLIGRGSMGLVIQARDVNLQRIVALKVLRKRIKGMDDRQGVDQFLREARVAAQIEHPNIVRVYEIAEHDGWWYIAMEMVEGETLRDVVKAVGSLVPERACPIVADAATALAVAHESGIIHRDVKPNNVMISRTGRGKLADFGLVRVSDPNDPFDFTDKSVGTPQYMAPEIIRQERATPACDVYGLGGTLYFAMTGHPPYTGANISQVLRQHCDAPVPNLRERLPDCPQSLVELVQRAMAKDPQERPTASQFAAALRAESIALRGEESSIFSGIGASMVGESSIIGARRKAESRRRRRIATGSVIAGVPLLAMIVLVVWALVYRGPDEGQPMPVGDVAEYFDTTFGQAPLTYGVREPASRPEGHWPEPASPPRFGWADGTPRQGAAFVAHARGRLYWPIDAPAAMLIPADDAVFYPDAVSAERAGKIAAP